MRILIIALTAVAIVGYLGFVASNIGTRVPVRIFQTDYPDVSVNLVVIASLLIGAVGMGIIAIVEGAVIRLENRRLRREQQKLETELNFLRTQPTAQQRSEPDSLVDESRPGAADPADDDARHVPSAPVYDDDDGWPDDDEDVYSGGRAV